MRGGCSLLILAGGLSRRMGRDKAALPAGHGALLEHLARRLAPVVEETIVAGGQVRPFDRVTIVEDRYPGLGPLAGMHAGMLAAQCRLVWVVGCDLPDVDPGLALLFSRLARDVDAVVPRIDAQPQGLCALYDRALASRIDGLLRDGERRVSALLAASNVRYVAEEELKVVDAELRSFRNLNTPADYQAWLTTQPASP